MAPTAINLEMRVATLSVGSGEPYSTIAAAVAAAQNGDTIEVQAGTYVNDYVSISKNITLQGVGGMVSMVSTVLIPNGKAIIITTLVLLSGFMTLLSSSFGGAFYIGLLISLCLFVALIMELTITPILILLFYKRQN